MSGVPDEIESVMIMLLDRLGPNLSFVAKVGWSDSNQNFFFLALDFYRRFLVEQVVSVLDLQCDIDSLVSVYPLRRSRAELEQGVC